MATISSKASTLAIKEESTPGTPVLPSASTDYVALQGDYDFNPAIDTITNPELTGTIGAAAPILGAENPTASFSHTLRHSGVEAQSPDYDLLLKGTLGAKTVYSTQYATTSLGTTSVANVGSGANFSVGQALLIKDSTNGYNIRNISAINTNALSLAFAVPVAVPNAVNLGKCVKYYPANTLPSLTLTEFEGNGGLIQLIAGAQIGSMTLTADPAQLLNASYQFQGSEYFFNPIEIKSTNKYLDYDDGSTQVAVLDEKLYKTPHDLASAIEAKLEANGGSYTVTYSNSTGKFTILKSSGTLELLFATGTNVANSIAATIGFNATDLTGFLTYTSQGVISLSSPQTPNYDDTNPLPGKASEIYVGSVTDNACFGARNFTMTVTNALANIPDLCEESGSSGKQNTARTVVFEISSTAAKYDVSKYQAFKDGTTVQFMYNNGQKSGGNWIPGTCVNVFCPTAKISNFKVDKQDDLSTFSFTLKAFVQDLADEIYFNLV